MAIQRILSTQRQRQRQLKIKFKNCECHFTLFCINEGNRIESFLFSNGGNPQMHQKCEIFRLFFWGFFFSFRFLAITYYLHTGLSLSNNIMLLDTW